MDLQFTHLDDYTESEFIHFLLLRSHFDCSTFFHFLPSFFFGDVTLGFWYISSLDQLVELFIELVDTS